MRKIVVHLGKRSYPIIIGRRLLSSVGKWVKPLGTGGKVLIISNRKVARLFLKTVSRSLARSGFRVFSHLLPHGGEPDKSQEELTKLWRVMSEIPLDRSGLVLALGGGVVGDVAGFAASTYMRGIALVQVPTTLVAQVDSAIGGKTAVDLPRAKNMVGTFYQPRMVISDVTTLMTLEPHEFRSQMAEVIKYGMIRDRKLFDLLERKAEWFFLRLQERRFSDPILSFLEHVVWRSAQVKAKVVEEDELEIKGRRMILNYGHTFAHALEAASGFRVAHGDAVASGMIFAGELASRMGIFSPSDQMRQKRLITRMGRPLRNRFSGSRILSYMERDKKNRGQRLKFVLPRAIGRVEVRDGVSKSEVRKLLEEYRSKK